MNTAFLQDPGFLKHVAICIVLIVAISFLLVYEWRRKPQSTIKIGSIPAFLELKSRIEGCQHIVSIPKLEEACDAFFDKHYSTTNIKTLKRFYSELRAALYKREEELSKQLPQLVS